MEKDLNKNKEEMSRGEVENMSNGRRKRYTKVSSHYRIVRGERIRISAHIRKITRKKNTKRR